MRHSFQIVGQYFIHSDLEMINCAKTELYYYCELRARHLINSVTSETVSQRQSMARNANPLGAIVCMFHELISGQIKETLCA